MHTKYAIIHADSTETTAASLSEARSVIAKRHNREPIEVGLEDRSSSCGTEENYNVWLAGCGHPGNESDLSVATIHREY